MTSIKIYSPFYNIRGTLVLLRWLFGFPLQAKDDFHTEFRFVLWLESLRVLVVCVMPIVGYLYLLFMCLMIDGNLENIFNVIQGSADTYSTSKLDQAQLFFWPVSAVIMSTSYFLLFKYNTQSINRFCNDVTLIKSTMAPMLNNRGKKEKRSRCVTFEKSEKLIIYGQILNLIASFSFGLFNYNLIMALPKDSIFNKYGYQYQVLLPPMNIIQNIFMLYGPISCAAELIICQIINSMSGLFKDWTIILQDKSGLHPKHPSSPQQVTNTTSSYDPKTGKM